MLSGGFALGAKIFRGIKLRLDRGDNRFSDLVLHGEHVGEVAVVALAQMWLPVVTSLSCA